MRKIEITEQPQGQRRWVALDSKSGQPVLRLHDRGLLEKVCRSLEWQIVERSGERRQGAFASTAK